MNFQMKSTNGKLLSHLKRLCTPNLGGNERAEFASFDQLPSNWPTHFNTVIGQLNKQILPAYKFSPNELCLGSVINTPKTLIEISCRELAEAEIRIQNNYVAQQSFNIYSYIVEHTIKCKAAFDHKVTASWDGVIEICKSLFGCK